MHNVFKSNASNLPNQKLATGLLASSTPTENASLSIGEIAPIPNHFPADIRNTFDRYTQVIPPNGKPINIYAQSNISDAQIIHARNTLVFFLTDVPNTTYGADKSAVANKMGENEATLLLLNGSDGKNETPDIDGQPLYETELVVPGSAAYINNDYANHRDATFEEILHLVHDTGIGVDGKDTLPGALPDFQANIRAATNNAIANNFQIWPLNAASDPEAKSWFEELSQENSLSQEYLAAVVDSYYGLWGAFQETDGGMWGEYIAKTRADIETKDPMGADLMKQFFSPFLTYDAQLDASLEGTFTMTFDANIPYTHKSQYLLHATLTGNNNANLTGNDQNNQLTGNSGNNVINGGLGDDTIDGGLGDDEIKGGGGDDTLTGGLGDDRIYGSAGNDRIDGQGGDDWLLGEAGDDVLRGGSGNDRLQGGQGDDFLRGGKGDDFLQGGKGEDFLRGGKGEDFLIGGNGDDFLIGGKGKDVFAYDRVDHRRDTITDFELGIDKIDLSFIFKGANYTSANAFNDYVKLVQFGADTKVKIDVLGDNGDQFKTVAQLINVDKTTLTADHFVLS